MVLQFLAGRKLRDYRGWELMIKLSPTKLILRDMLTIELGNSVL